MELKEQIVTTECPILRYRALHYYLEREGRSIESELCEHLKQMYWEQATKICER